MVPAGRRAVGTSPARTSVRAGGMTTAEVEIMTTGVGTVTAAGDGGRASGTGAGAKADTTGKGGRGGEKEERMIATRKGTPSRRAMATDPRCTTVPRRSIQRSRSTRTSSSNWRWAMPWGWRREWHWHRLWPSRACTAWARSKSWPWPAAARSPRRRRPAHRPRRRPVLRLPLRVGHRVARSPRPARPPGWRERLGRSLLRSRGLRSRGQGSQFRRLFQYRRRRAPPWHRPPPSSPPPLLSGSRSRATSSGTLSWS
mmetsp:Transcript_27241/g.70589  ORF Transcript_27241/g.70589 Transcript_27241/m.70589 type:complete len:256 (+) Transcript_27241:2878-3645(+)